MHRRRRVARSDGRLRLDDEPPRATAHDEYPKAPSAELGLSPNPAVDDTEGDRLPCRMNLRSVVRLDDIADGRRRLPHRVRQSHGSSIRRLGRNFLPTYKWGFSEPRFGQRAGQTRCARTTRLQSDATAHIRPTGRSARMSTGDEVVVAELRRAHVNVMPARFTGEASNHLQDCDLRRLRPWGASASAGRFQSCRGRPQYFAD